MRLSIKGQVISWLYPTPVLLPGKYMDGGAWWAAVHGVAKSQTPLSDFTFTFSLSCIGEGNGNPLQCSCLENLRDGRAWWAAVYGVAQSWTILKWLSSSSRTNQPNNCNLLNHVHYHALSGSWRSWSIWSLKPRSVQIFLWVLVTITIFQAELHLNLESM